MKVFFADEIDFSATAALFTLAHLVICNDAAPRHVAAAIGKKSLTLMPHHRRHSWQVYGEEQKAYFLFSDVPIESRARRHGRAGRTRGHDSKTYLIRVLVVCAATH
jgi:hypothetical protein